jgi:hypothetical protein
MRFELLTGNRQLTSAMNTAGEHVNRNRRIINLAYEGVPQHAIRPSVHVVRWKSGAGANAIFDAPAIALGWRRPPPA